VSAARGQIIEVPFSSPALKKDITSPPSAICVSAERRPGVRADVPARFRAVRISFKDLVAVGETLST